VKRSLAAFFSGLLFAAGLVVSGMTKPSKVLAFLDVSGAWDPSLALVMVGAIAVSAVAFRVAARRSAPVLDARFDVPPAGGPIARRLIAGAAIFGLGWGLSGLCPGPAVVSIASGQLGALVFVVAMIGGMALERATARDGRGAPQADCGAAEPIGAESRAP
jgi:uncharacterized membrane protein YedE/YeeE